MSLPQREDVLNLLKRHLLQSLYIINVFLIAVYLQNKVSDAMTLLVLRE